MRLDRRWICSLHFVESCLPWNNKSNNTFNFERYFDFICTVLLECHLVLFFCDNIICNIMLSRNLTPLENLDCLMLFLFVLSVWHSLHTTEPAFTGLPSCFDIHLKHLLEKSSINTHAFSVNFRLNNFCIETLMFLESRLCDSVSSHIVILYYGGVSPRRLYASTFESWCFTTFLGQVGKHRYSTFLVSWLSFSLLIIHRTHAKKCCREKLPSK